MIDASGYVAAAEVVYGTNGLSGSPEAFAGTTGDMDGGQVIWDPDPSDGFDSGWVPVSLHVKPGGGSEGLVWTVGDGLTTVTYSGADYDNINGIVITAAVSGAGMFMAWSSLQASYFFEGEMVEQIAVGSSSWPTANTLGQTSSYGFQDDYLIEASDTPNDEIIVTGFVRMATDFGVYPAPDSMASQIFVLPEA
jgi:hypothetical protein